MQNPNQAHHTDLARASRRPAALSRFRTSFCAVEQRRFVLIAAISAFSTILLVYTIRTTGAVFASQAGYSMTAAGILWSVVLLDETMTIWVWAALACLISGLALVMPKQQDYDDERAAEGIPIPPTTPVQRESG